MPYQVVFNHPEQGQLPLQCRRPDDHLPVVLPVHVNTPPKEFATAELAQELIDGTGAYAACPALPAALFEVVLV